MKIDIKTQRTLHMALWLVLTAVILTGCSTGMHHHAAATTDANQLKEKWGVEPVALRLTAADHMIDFRYRVIDPDKAKALLSRDNTPYLIDEASGKVHTVPLTKLGSLRASSVKPKANRNYVVLFGNTHKVIKKGSLVTVVIGEFRAEHMKVM